MRRVAGKLLSMFVVLAPWEGLHRIIMGLNQVHGAAEAGGLVFGVQLTRAGGCVAWAFPSFLAAWGS